MPCQRLRRHLAAVLQLANVVRSLDRRVAGSLAPADT